MDSFENMSQIQNNYEKSLTNSLIAYNSYQFLTVYLN